MAVEQGPVVAGDALGLLGRERERRGQERGEDLGRSLRRATLFQLDVYLWSDNNGIKLRALELVTAVTNTHGMKWSQPPHPGQEV